MTADSKLFYFVVFVIFFRTQTHNPSLSSKAPQLQKRRAKGCENSAIFKLKVSTRLDNVWGPRSTSVLHRCSLRKCYTCGAEAGADIRCFTRRARFISRDARSMLSLGSSRDARASFPRASRDVVVSPRSFIIALIAFPYIFHALFTAFSDLFSIFKRRVRNRERFNNISPIALVKRRGPRPRQLAGGALARASLMANPSKGPHQRANLIRYSDR